ncbi:MAG: hypothetical protein N4A72_11385 [Bacteroidales bacterium]|nr:hypothetical protein [Bacteroidales bacterium]
MNWLYNIRVFVCLLFVYSTYTFAAGEINTPNASTEAPGMTPPDPQEFVITLEVKTYYSFDVRNFLINSGWDGITPVRIIIPAGTVIGSESTSTPSLNIRDVRFPEKVTIENHGEIIGRGGNGARSNCGDYRYGNTHSNGYAGGPAIGMSGDGTIIIDNHGLIAGGGGGGGGGGLGKYASAGAGGGGAGVPAGIRGDRGKSPLYGGYKLAADGTKYTGGRGGNPTYCYKRGWAGNGGCGGNLGSAGCKTAGYGGAGGNAINKEDDTMFSWINIGNVAGASPSGPVISSITSEPAQPITGQPVEIKWDVTDATNMLLYIGDDQPVNVTGQSSHTVTFSESGINSVRLVAKSATNVSSERTLDILTAYAPATVNDISVNPLVVESGDDATVTWDIDDADRVEIYSPDDQNYNPAVDVTNSEPYSITPPTGSGVYTYVVRATNPDGEVTEETFYINVRPFYMVPYSLRFDNIERSGADIKYLKYTPDTDGNRKKWTLSFWIKLLKKDKSMSLFSSIITGSESLYIFIDAEGNIYIIDPKEGKGRPTNLGANNLFTRLNEWQHVVIVYDSEQTDQNRRLEYYINNTKAPVMILNDYPTENAESNFNTATGHSIGAVLNSAGDAPMVGRESDYYISEIHFVDGLVVDRGMFGENKDGRWAPKSYDGQYGTNGYYLTFSDQINIGHDMSGNQNNWQAVGNWSKDGDKYIDQMLDSPTRNFPVIDVNNTYSEFKLTKGNLRYTANTITGSGRSSALITDKVYWEYKTNNDISDSKRFYQGVGSVDMELSYSYPGSQQISGAFDNFQYFHNNNGSGEVVSQVTGEGYQFVANDIGKVAFNATENKLWFGKNTEWINNGNPQEGSNAAILLSNTTYYSIIGAKSIASEQVDVEVNYGQGGQSGLSDYVFNPELGNWIVPLPGMIPDARFAYMPLNGYSTIAGNVSLARILSFTLDHERIQPSGSIQFDWSVTGSDKDEIWIDGSLMQDVTGTTTLTTTAPSGTGVYSYMLKSYTSEGGVTQRSLSLTVSDDLVLQSVNINNGAENSPSSSPLQAIPVGMLPTDARLIHNWLVDNGSGEQSIVLVNIPFDGGTYKDYSDNNYVGATGQSDGPDYIVESYKKGGVNFNGVDDFIEFPLPLGTFFNQNYTISVRFKPNGQQNESALINLRNFRNDNSSGDVRAGQILLMPDKRLKFMCKGSSDATVITKMSSTGYNDNWNHLIISKSGSEYRVYLNGTELTELRTTVSGSTMISDYNILMGKHKYVESGNTVETYYKGEIDEFLILKRSITQEQVSSMFNNGLSIIQPSEISEGEKWKVKVVATDNTDYTSVKISQIITVDENSRRIIIVGK